MIGKYLFDTPQTNDIFHLHQHNLKELCGNLSILQPSKTSEIVLS